MTIFSGIYPNTYKKSSCKDVTLSGETEETCSVTCNLTYIWIPRLISYSSYAFSISWGHFYVEETGGGLLIIASDQLFSSINA